MKKDAIAGCGGAGKAARAAVFAFLAACAAQCSGAASPAAARKVVNIVNFARSLDPRHPKERHERVLREEVALNLEYGFKNTILFQYDALVDDTLRNIALRSDPAKTEFGLWFEMSRPLNEAAGVPWRPKHNPKWEWDWYINPGFLMAYTHAERKALIDAAFAKFKEYFGRYPESAGSWLLDAWSMDYMAETYGVDAFCICREQDNTDAYGLRGGYSNGAYYPSKRNMLSAAVDMSNAVKSPVFKMLTPDPIYNYAWPHKRYPRFKYGNLCTTMEPVNHPSGDTPQMIEWYFRTYLDAPALNLVYMQTGQENSFSWKSIQKGLEYQLKRIDELSKAGKVEVETLGETGRRFKKDHPRNCPQIQVGLEDWTGCGRNSIWYNCRHYRANLFLDEGKLYFRDIHKMCDAFEEPFLDKVCTGWKAEYYTPPVVDEHMFSDRKNGVAGVLAFDGAFEKLEASARPCGVLVATALRKDGSKAVAIFDERGMTVSSANLEADWKQGFRKDVSFRGGIATFKFLGFGYSVGFEGDVEETPTGARIAPRAGKIRLDLSL